MLILALGAASVSAVAGPQCEPSAAPSRDPGAPQTHVVIETVYGRVVAEVFTVAAPLTAANFLRYVDEGLYQDATFYRAVRPDNNKLPTKIAVIQGGIDPTVRHPPLPPIAHETTAMTGLRHLDGTLLMARWEPGTAASEFAILIGDSPEMDFGGSRSGDGQGFAAFGRVVDGMEVVRKINAGPTDGVTTNDYMKGQALTRPVAMRIARCLQAADAAAAAKASP